MSKDFSMPGNEHPALTHDVADAARSVQIAPRLHPVERSDRAIVANVSAARLASSMVFIDFGFIDQQAIDQSTRDTRAGKVSDGKFEGRRECRIAMSKGDTGHLLQQQRLLTTRATRPQNFHSGASAGDVAEPFALDNSASLQ